MVYMNEYNLKQKVIIYEALQQMALFHHKRVKEYGETPKVLQKENALMDMQKDLESFNDILEIIETMKGCV